MTIAGLLRVMYARRASSPVVAGAIARGREALPRALKALTTAELERGLRSPQFASGKASDRWDDCFVGLAVGKDHLPELFTRPGGVALHAVGIAFAGAGSFRELVRTEAIRELAERGVAPEPAVTERSCA